MKYLVAAFLLAMSIQSFGQFTKGDKITGGTFYLDSYWDGPDDGEQDKDKTTHLRFSPSFGVMVTDNLEVGGVIGYSMNKYFRTNSSIQENINHIVAPGIYAQKYFPINEKFFFAIKGETNFGIRKHTESREDTNTTTLTDNGWKSNSISVELEPALLFFPSPNLAIRGSLGELGYTHSRNQTNNTSTSGLSARYGNIYLGLHYYFRAKK